MSRAIKAETKVMRKTNAPGRGAVGKGQTTGPMKGSPNKNSKAAQGAGGGKGKFQSPSDVRKAARNESTGGKGRRARSASPPKRKSVTVAPANIDDLPYTPFTFKEYKASCGPVKLGGLGADLLCEKHLIAKGKKDREEEFGKTAFAKNLGHLRAKTELLSPKSLPTLKKYTPTQLIDGVATPLNKKVPLSSDNPETSTFLTGGDSDPDDESTNMIKGTRQLHNVAEVNNEDYDEEQVAKIQAMARGNAARKEVAQIKEGNDAWLDHVKMFDAVEKELKEIAAKKKKFTVLWKTVDFNGNGIASLAEIDKMVVEKFEILNHKPALMRAYKRTCSKAGGGDGDDWVEKKELVMLLQNLVLFNKLFKVFDDIDTGDDRRVDIDEFKKSLKRLGMSMPPADAEEEFKSIDLNGGGQVLFDEFCKWYLGKVGAPQKSG